MVWTADVVENLGCFVLDVETTAGVSSLCGRGRGRQALVIVFASSPVSPNVGAPRGLAALGDGGQVFGEHDHVFITDIYIYLYLYNHGLAFNFGYGEGRRRIGRRRRAGERVATCYVCLGRPLHCHRWPH